jgi:hypothetical protein
MGKWSGWWEQRGLGRQEMRNLVLDVGPTGEASGSGDDYRLRHELNTARPD